MSSFQQSLEDTTYIPPADKFFKGVEDEKLMDIEITTEVVRRKLQGLRADKSPGADNMSPRLLKEIADEIAHPAALLFNQSLKQGCVPLDWRIANVTPIFKKGSRNDATNYRPVSLTSQLSKVLESIIRDAVCG